MVHCAARRGFSTAASCQVGVPCSPSSARAFSRSALGVCRRTLWLCRDGWSPVRVCSVTLIFSVGAPCPQRTPGWPSVPRSPGRASVPRSPGRPSVPRTPGRPSSQVAVSALWFFCGLGSAFGRCGVGLCAGGWLQGWRHGPCEPTGGCPLPFFPGEASGTSVESPVGAGEAVWAGGSTPAPCALPPVPQARSRGSLAPHAVAVVMLPPAGVGGVCWPLPLCSCPAVRGTPGGRRAEGPAAPPCPVRLSPLVLPSLLPAVGSTFAEPPRNCHRGCGTARSPRSRVVTRAHLASGAARGLCDPQGTGALRGLCRWTDGQTGSPRLCLSPLAGSSGSVPVWGARGPFARV